MKNTLTTRQRVVLISTLVGTLLTTIGLSAVYASATGASSTGAVSTALDSSVVVTAVIPGVTGDGSVAGHGPGSIQVDGWNWGVVRSSSVGAGTGASGGKVKFNEFTIKKSTDQATPILFQNCTVGAHFPSVTLYFDEPDQTGAAGGVTYTTYMTITLTDASVTSDSISGDGGDRPTEILTLNFTKATMTYSAPGGKTTTVSWRVSLLK
jgi:type VI secretion system Hcp family effector